MLFFGIPIGFAISNSIDNDLFGDERDDLKKIFEASKLPDQEESGVVTYRPRIVQFPKKQWAKIMAMMHLIDRKSSQFKLGFQRKIIERKDLNEAFHDA